MRQLALGIIALAILAGFSVSCTRKDTVTVLVDSPIGTALKLCIIGEVTRMEGLEGSITDGDTVQVRITDSIFRLEGELLGIILLPDTEGEALAKVRSIDLTSCPNLAYFGLDGGHIGQIDLSQNPKLEFLSLENMNLATPRLAGNPELIDLRLRNCGLESIDLSHNPKLKYLLLDKNHFTTLDLSACTSLELLCCSGSSLQQLDVSSLPQLKWLWCNHNDLAALNLASNAQLELLDCSRNRIRSLDLGNCPNLVEVSAHTNIMLREGMAQLVNTLPSSRSGVGKFVPLRPNAIDDMNELEESLRSTITSKGWRVASPSETTPVDALFGQ